MVKSHLPLSWFHESNSLPKLSKLSQRLVPVESIKEKNSFSRAVFIFYLLFSGSQRLKTDTSESDTVIKLT